MHLSRYEMYIASSISQTKLLRGKILCISYRYLVNQTSCAFVCTTIFMHVSSLYVDMPVFYVGKFNRCILCKVCTPKCLL